MYFFRAEGRVIKMIFFTENREIFAFSRNRTLCGFRTSWQQNIRDNCGDMGREMNLCSGVQLGSYQMREKSSSPIKKIHCGVCLHTDIISFIWRHFKLMYRREEPVGEVRDWGFEKQFCFLSLTTSPILAGSRECPWFCWQLHPDWRPDKPKYLEALVYVLVYCS